MHQDQPSWECVPPKYGLEHFPPSARNCVGRIPAYIAVTWVDLLRTVAYISIPLQVLHDCGQPHESDTMNIMAMVYFISVPLKVVSVNTKRLIGRWQ